MMWTYDYWYGVLCLCLSGIVELACVYTLSGMSTSNTVQYSVLYYKSVEIEPAFSFNV